MFYALKKKNANNIYREIINRCSGSLVRTKLASSNEGGVTAGYACLSTPYLS